MNFQKIIQELLDGGMTQVEIAEHCDCRQSTISDIHTGKTQMPNFALGLALVELHKQRVKQAA